MQGNPSNNPSTLRPHQATAAELVAGGKNIAIPAEQPLGELTQSPVKEYSLLADPDEINREEARLFKWAMANHRLFPDLEIDEFENQAGHQGGGSEHDVWKIETPDFAFMIRRTINDCYGFRFSSPFQYLRRMAEFSIQVPCAAIKFLGVSKNSRGNGVIWTVQPYIEGDHLSQGALVTHLGKSGWRRVVTRDNHLVFEHAATGIRMHDVHSGNFIRQKNGALVPIDVYFEGIKSGL